MYHNAIQLNNLLIDIELRPSSSLSTH